MSLHLHRGELGPPGDHPDHRKPVAGTEMESVGVMKGFIRLA